MGTLNPAGSNPRFNAAVSANGNVQHLKCPKDQLLELLSTVLFGKSDYYSSTEQRVVQLQSILTTLVQSGDLDFVANAIVFARQKMNIRTFPIVAAVLFAKTLRDQKVTYPKLRLLVNSVIQRADQINDLLNFSIKTFGGKGKVPTAIKRGVADACNNFNEYHFAKYDRGTELKFSDTLRIVHPRPIDDTQAVVFDRIMNSSRPADQQTSNGLLATPYTWETQLSASTDKAKTWFELVESGKLGYTALLKNLRNIEECPGITSNILQKMAAVISDPARIATSRVLPFDLITAHDNCTAQILRTAINNALEHSLVNVEPIADKLWIVVDASSSMTYGGVNRLRAAGAQFCAAEAAAVLAAAIIKNSAANPLRNTQLHITLFNSRAFTIKIEPNDTITTIRRQVRQAMTGGDTKLNMALDQYTTKVVPFEPDVTIVLSDMQVNRMGSFNVASIPGTKIALNVSADPSTPLSDLMGWKQVTGFTSTTLDFIRHSVNGGDYMELFEKPFIGQF